MEAYCFGEDVQKVMRRQVAGHHCKLLVVLMDKLEGINGFCKYHSDVIMKLLEKIKAHKRSSFVNMYKFVYFYGYVSIIRISHDTQHFDFHPLPDSTIFSCVLLCETVT